MRGLGLVGAADRFVAFRTEREALGDSVRGGQLGSSSRRLLASMRGLGLVGPTRCFVTFGSKLVELVRGRRKHQQLVELEIEYVGKSA
ncbi:MAG TPA: hypothetical protein VK034_24010 [Enhygromyxa sp.]|nr:hypothetical protein [Enhygromyxa sp.]